MNLYIVSTPIGNLQDITLRAAHVLLKSPTIIAESTSKAGILLEFLKKQFPEFEFTEKQIISLTEDEEDQKIPSILRIIEVNDVVLISEAGTPLISDPGFKLVRQAIKRGINIIPIPGPTAAIAALTASGLPPDKFLFLGYLPKKEGKRHEVLANLKEVRKIINTTTIVYESPHRLTETLKTVRTVFGDIDIAIARELTKIHEEIRREKISEAIKHFESNKPRGEFAILL